MTTHRNKRAARDYFVVTCMSLGIPEPHVEYRFHDTRRWRVDYCWPEYKLAVEIEGGVWTYGRHNRASGFEKDREKYNELALAGYHLLRFTPQEVQSGEAAITVKDWFDERGENG